MAWLRGLAAVLLTVAGLVLIAPAPAWACSCAQGDADEFARWADVVVVGTVTDREPPPPEEVMSTADPATYTVAVTRVLKGEAAPTTQVLSAISGASCGLEGIEIGAEYVVFAAHDGGELWANGCGGTRLAAPGFVADVEQETGPGRVLEPVAATEPAAANLSGDDPVAQSVVPWWAWAGGLGLLVGLGVVAMVVVAGRRT